jgi:hypothetical protein
MAFAINASAAKATLLATPRNGQLKARASTLCVGVPPAPRPDILSLDFILEGPR